MTGMKKGKGWKYHGIIATKERQCRRAFGREAGAVRYDSKEALEMDTTSCRGRHIHT